MNWQLLLKTLTERGMTQQQIATECGCSQASISDLATGKTKNPTYQIGATLQTLLKKSARQSRKK
jgi:transcriptional regulator with XRE-family HTH domain